MLKGEKLAAPDPLHNLFNLLAYLHDGTNSVGPHIQNSNVLSQLYSEVEKLKAKSILKTVPPEQLTNLFKTLNSVILQGQETILENTTESVILSNIIN